MPKNNVTDSIDGRKRYRFTDTSGKDHDIRKRKNENVKQFKKRCEKLESVDKDIYDMEFSDLFAKWQKEYQFIYCSQADIRSLRESYALHIQDEIGHYKVHEITRAVLYKILAELSGKGRSASLIANVRSVISRPYNWAINTLGYNLVSPTSGLIIKSKKKEYSKNDGIRIISDDEYQTFFEAAKDSKYINYFKVLRYTGMRPSEAAGLQVADDMGKYLSIKRAVTEYETSPLKTNAAVRDIPITPLLREALDDQYKLINKKTATWLFPSSSGDPSMNAIKLAFKRVLMQSAVWKKVDRKYHGEIITPSLKFTLYNFRHTFATNAARVLRPNQLQYVMGHSSIEITLKYYVGLSSDDHNETANKLEEMFFKKDGTKYGTNG